MIKKILIANRGEIACRVIKTAKAMGITTVAVYSDVDANALHVKHADEAICIGPAPSKDSYLRGTYILQQAKALNVDAIHPGYGFLSENAQFAKDCAQEGIIFIGPTIEAIEAMGSKSAAKQIMEEAGVPLVPGYHGDDQDPAIIKRSANEMGYPVLLKATAGGGGKGMRQVWSEAEFDDALAAAKREAMSSFSDDKMLVEKYLTEPRHVEIQVFCDNHKNGVYLFERDCSIQRRHQKVIEEAPAPNMSEELRAKMGEAALKAAFAINYSGAGTVEFLLDTDGSFYFMEMNTRLQVEHPVTEMITGEDLVEWQIRVANNELLPKKQSDLKIHGHSFEARVYAEDPNNDFLPSTGTLHLLKTPKTNSNVRVDTGVLQGDEVSIYYDPMIAKLIVWDEDREKALSRLETCLGEYAIGGVTTNIDYLRRIAGSTPFKEAKLTTDFIERHNDSISTQTSVEVDKYLPALLLGQLLLEHNSISADSEGVLQTSPWQKHDSYRSNLSHKSALELTVNDKNYTAFTTINADRSWMISIDEREYLASGTLADDILTCTIDGIKARYPIMLNSNHISLFTPQGILCAEVVQPDLGETGEDDHANSVTAPMNGTVVALLVKAGEKVKKGQQLIIVEAMKMEHSIKAPYDGIVAECYFSTGDLVSGGVALIDITADESE
ncbi:acetyl/propionyl/methylcrotonyl-CoA carboxylase subunit alpha [Glaciecola sp. MF2-115]|uniref:acetyl/propionyl/methylcrotonyl-CoA carboxylase subunit alpha n=1 Tax=Glaciecola sp. MF2-115 TaxID=3384827 RepID=UPI00399F679C